MKKSIINWWITLSLLVTLLASCATPETAPSQPEPAIPSTSEAQDTQAEKPVATSAPAEEKPTEVVEVSNVSNDLLRLGWPEGANILNPHMSSGVINSWASNFFYEPLARYDENGELVPWLGSEIPSLENGGLSEDGTSVTWKLREGVVWHDGTPFTAEDVVFTFAYVSNPEVGALTKGYYDQVKDVEKIDDYTVKINFKEPTPVWFIPFTGVNGCILPKHIFEEYAGPKSFEAPANISPIGTGPYTLVKFEPGNTLIGEAFPDYWIDGQPYIKRIEVITISDSMTLTQAGFVLGEVDMITNALADPAIVDEMESHGLMKYNPLLRPNTERILINFTDPNQVDPDTGEKSSVKFPHPFMTDLRVRQAIAYSLDRWTIAEQVYGMAGVAGCDNFTIPEKFISGKQHLTCEYNLDKAKALLDEAGWVDANGDGVREKDGVELSILYQAPVHAYRQKVQQIFKQALEDVGFKVELKSVDPAIWYSSDPSNPDTNAHFFADIEQYNSGIEGVDPGAYFGFYTCAQISQQANNYTGRNYHRYCNPEYDQLYEQTKFELDAEKRALLFQQLNDILIDDVVMIPIIVRTEVHSLNPRLDSPGLNVWDSPYWKIREWQFIK